MLSKYPNNTAHLAFLLSTTAKSLVKSGVESSDSLITGLRLTLVKDKVVLFLVDMTRREALLQAQEQKQKQGKAAPSIDYAYVLSGTAQVRGESFDVKVYVYSPTQACEKHLVRVTVLDQTISFKERHSHAS
jgi:hypothetical protein